MYCRVQILPTTIYNYKDMAKLYKEQSQLGYSKMMPQIAKLNNKDLLHHPKYSFQEPNYHQY